MRRGVLLVVAIVVVAVLGGTTVVMTQPGGLRSGGPRTASTHLRSYDEVPAISTPGTGRFSATVNAAGTELTYELEYADLAGNVAQAHIHIGTAGRQRGDHGVPLHEPG